LTEDALTLGENALQADHNEINIRQFLQARQRKQAATVAQTNTRSNLFEDLQSGENKFTRP
jgi:hypothetical protein